MTLNVNSLLCRRFYACCDQIVEARITLFHYNVALYNSYLSIKFDDDIQEGPLIWGSQNRVEWFSTSWHHILKTELSVFRLDKLITLSNL